MGRPLLLFFWPLLPLLSLRPSPRLMPTPTFCMEDMVWDTLDMLDTLAMEDTMDMDLDMLDTMVLDTMVLDTEFMASALLMPSQKLTPTFCMEDMDTLDMPDTMDIPMVDMPTMDKLFPLISKWTANHP